MNSTIIDNLSYDVVRVIDNGRTQSEAAQSEGWVKIGTSRNFLAQRRKDAKRCRVSKGFLCAFAPLRERYFFASSLPERHLSTFVQSKYFRAKPERRLGRAVQNFVQRV